MSLIDPISKFPFSVSALAKIRWVAAPLSGAAIATARRSARRMDWAQACASYTRALRLKPRDGSLWVQLGHSLGNMGQNDASQIAYANAIRIDPRFPLGHKHLGLVRYRTSLHDKGMQSLACALFLDPSDGELRDVLVGEEGYAKIEARMAVEALTLADRHADPAYIGARATFLRARARAAGRRRQWSRAEGLYRRLTRIRPRDAHGFVQLGHALNEQNKHKEAEEAYRRATVASPLSADAWLHLGYVLTAQRQYLLAREAFAVVNRIAPTRREEHPILESADPVLQAGSAHLQDAAGRERLACPDGLGQREESIWLRLATQIERKL